MKRTAEEQEELVAKAWRLAVEGRTQHEIAAELGVCQGQVSRLAAKGRGIPCRARGRRDDPSFPPLTGTNQPAVAVGDGGVPSVLPAEQEDDP